MYLLYRFGHWYTWTSGASAKLLCGLTGSLLVLGCAGHLAHLVLLVIVPAAVAGLAVEEASVGLLLRCLSPVAATTH